LFQKSIQGVCRPPSHASAFFGVDAISFHLSRRDARQM